MTKYRLGFRCFWWVSRMLRLTDRIRCLKVNVRMVFVTCIAASVLVCPFGAGATPHGNMQYDEIRVDSNLSAIKYSQFEMLFSRAVKTHDVLSFSGPLSRCVASAAKNTLLANVQLDALLQSSSKGGHAQSVRYDFRRLLAAARRNFLNGMERDDDLITQRAVIYRPDRKLVVYLDLRRKLYDEQRVNTLNSAVRGQEFPPTQTFSDIRYTERRFNIGITKIAGQRAKGFRVDSSIQMRRNVFGVFKQTISQIGQSTTLAFLDFKDPRCSMSAVNKTPGAEDYYRPDLRRMAASERSKFTVVEGGPPLPDRFVVYRVSVGELESGKGFTTVMRGHLKALGPEDRTMFDVPPGFSRDSRTGALGF